MSADSVGPCVAGLMDIICQDCYCSVRVMKLSILIVCLIVSYLADCTATSAASTHDFPTNKFPTFAENLVRTLVADTKKP